MTHIQTRGGEHHHQAWITTGDHKTVACKLTACQTAFAMFTEYFYQDIHMYEIGMGMDLNRRAVIKKDYQQVRHVRNVTGKIL